MVISRDEFNEKYNTDIKELRRDLYAIGLCDGVVNVYNDDRKMWYEVMPQWSHIIKVALGFTKIRKFYFIFCSSDGYMEEQRHEDPSAYSISHSKRWIVCNSAPINIPYTIATPDRHVLHLCETYHYQIGRAHV